jgi:hypothetical protein
MRKYRVCLNLDRNAVQVVEAEHLGYQSDGHGNTLVALFVTERPEGGEPEDVTKLVVPSNVLAFIREIEQTPAEEKLEELRQAIRELHKLKAVEVDGVDYLKYDDVADALFGYDDDEV